METGRSAEPGDGHPVGPSLWLLYTLIGLALVAAIGIAALIVLPFYLRR
ncbi:MAG: hypothetical protein ABSF23_11170 [Terracidiphilus sp.]